MDLNRIQMFLAQVAAPGGTVPDQRGEMIKTVVMLACFGAMFYFVLIRPQQKRAKQQAELLKSIKPGDKVITAAGLIGVVLTVKEKSVTLRSADAKLELSKSAVTEITERGSSTVEA